MFRINGASGAVCCEQWGPFFRKGNRLFAGPRGFPIANRHSQVLLLPLNKLRTTAGQHLVVWNTLAVWYISHEHPPNFTFLGHTFSGACQRRHGRGAKGCCVHWVFLLARPCCRAKSVLPRPVVGPKAVFAMHAAQIGKTSHVGKIILLLVEMHKLHDAKGTTQISKSTLPI